MSKAPSHSGGRLAIADYYVDIYSIPKARGQLSVYSVPAVLVYFKGRELIREARHFGIMELPHI